MVFGQKPYSRRDSLTAADTALKKHNSKKAVKEYEKVLANDGEDPMVLKRLADSLIASKRPDEAKPKFLAAAEVYARQGFSDKALALYALMTTHYSSELAVWGRYADALVEKKRPAEAVKQLLDARVHFKRRDQVDERFVLLEKIREIEPWQFDASFELATRLAKSGQRGQAKSMFLELASRTRGAQLRRTWGRVLVLYPGPRVLYRWLKAALIGR